MVALRNPADSQPAICPACGASVKMPGREKQRRMQCPRCREVVLFERAEVPPEQVVETANMLTEREQQRVRIDALEARIAALESAVPSSIPAKHQPTSSSAMPMSLNGSRPPDFSPEQAEMLRKNLRGIPVQWINILSPQGDTAARTCAEWFKEVFESAQWVVHCVQDAHLARPARGLCFASRVPATPEVAATYFAIRGAGFDLATENDPDLKETEQRLIVS